MKLIFSQLNERLEIYRFPTDYLIDQKWFKAPFVSITKTTDELSVVITENTIKNTLDNVKVDKNWKGLKVEGPLDFSLVGIIASISAVLAKEGISIFAVSTFDTDYILVKEKDLMRAKELLTIAGYLILEDKIT